MESRRINWSFISSLFILIIRRSCSHSGNRNPESFAAKVSLTMKAIKYPPLTVAFLQNKVYMDCWIRIFCYYSFKELQLFIFTESEKVINGLIHVNLKPTPSQAKKSRGGHLSHYVFCVEGCLRLQKNIGLRPINRRNTASQRFWCKWAFTWVFCIGNTGKFHFLAHICYFELLKCFL